MSALACTLTLVLLGASPLGASPPSPQGRLLFDAAPARLDARVGEWVTYEMDGGPQQGFMRLAVVAEQKDALNRDAVWVELEFGQHPELRAPLAQFLLLVARETGLRKEGVSRFFVTQGVEKLQEVDARALPHFLGPAGPEALRAAPPLPSSPGQGTSVHRGTPSRLMTLAGTVTAEPLEVRVQRLVLKRYWISPEIPILHLARLEFPPIQYRMEVRDHGVDARPRLRPPASSDPKIRLEPITRLPRHFQPLIQSDSLGPKENLP